MRISKSTILSLLALLVILIGIPLALITHEAGRTGQTVGQYLKRALTKTGVEKPLNATNISCPGKK